MKVWTKLNIKMCCQILATVTPFNSELQKVKESIQIIKLSKINLTDSEAKTSCPSQTWKKNTFLSILKFWNTDLAEKPVSYDKFEIATKQHKSNI